MFWLKSERSPPKTPDVSSFEALLQRGFRYALSLTHEESGAEDLLQDACVAVLRAHGPWNRAYLFRAIRSRFVDLHRRELVVSMESRPALDDTPSSLDDALAGETARADARAVERALAGLRAEEREALFLAAVEGYTAAEAADFTGRPRGTILSLVFRARRKLERALGHANAKDRS